jgi:N-methylhydantoinase A/oxoprolinase/acetone carboxylase beta subunit
LMIRRVVIPPSAGVFSSYALLYSEVAYHFTKTRKTLLAAIDPAEIGAIVGELEGEARTRLAEDGFVEDRIAIERAAALHYQGQSFELEVPVPGGVIDRAVLSALDEAFGVEHEKTYGHRAGIRGAGGACHPESGRPWLPRRAARGTGGQGRSAGKCSHLAAPAAGLFRFDPWLA